MRGVFVTGTDTGVGKTVVSALLVSALRRSGPIDASGAAPAARDYGPASAASASPSAAGRFIFIRNGSLSTMPVTRADSR